MSEFKVGDRVRWEGRLGVVARIRSLDEPIKVSLDETSDKPPGFAWVDAAELSYAAPEPRPLKVGDRVLPMGTECRFPGVVRSVRTGYVVVKWPEGINLLVDWDPEKLHLCGPSQETPAPEAEPRLFKMGDRVVVQGRRGKIVGLGTASAQVSLGPTNDLPPMYKWFDVLELMPVGDSDEARNWRRIDVNSPYRFVPEPTPETPAPEPEHVQCNVPTHETLVGDHSRLKAEVRELLIENATLRRRLEKLEKKR